VLRLVLLPAAATLGFASCNAAPPEVGEQRAIMARIEQLVALPDGASPLDAYSRNYARQSDGTIVAHYVLPHPVLDDDSIDAGCSAMTEDSELRPCTEDEIKDMREMDERIAATFGEANQSRWFASPGELPSMYDGGCAQIEIVFDPVAGHFDRVQCNGVV